MHACIRTFVYMQRCLYKQMCDIYIFTCMYTYVYKYRDKHMYPSVYLPICLSVKLSIYQYVSLIPLGSMFLCVHKDTRTHEQTHTHTRARARRHTHTHTHTHTHPSSHACHSSRSRKQGMHQGLATYEAGLAEKLTSNFLSDCFLHQNPLCR